MSQNNQFQQIANEAADPNVDPNRLRQIAGEYPGLHVVIAKNPVAYEGLLEWMEAQGNPEVIAAIAARRSALGGLAAPALQGQQQGQQQVQFQPEAQQQAQDQAQAQPQTQPQAAFPVITPALPATNLEAEEKNSTRGVIILIVLALLAIVLVAGAVAMATGMFNGLFGNSDTPSAKQKNVPVEATFESTAEVAPQPEQTEEIKQPTPEGTTEESPEPKIRFPEPDGSFVLPAFSSPSQNIFCNIQEDEVFCAISTRNYAKDGPNACFGLFGMKISGEGPAIATCNDGAANSLPGTAPVLDYGASAANDKFACTMSQTGVNCWNKFTGAQFSLRRAAFQVEQR